MPLLNNLPVNIGWRVAFGLGVVLGLATLLVRRHVPESPRWLFIHGRGDEAEKIVQGVEREVEKDVGAALPEPRQAITIHTRKSIGFIRIAHTMVALYPRRTVLGLSLFIGQAFLYNAITFGYAQILSTFYEIDTHTGYYFAVIAVGNFLGPLLLGRLFDSIGRVPMISAGGIAGPLIFAKLVSSGVPGDTALAFTIGAILMILAGIVEMIFGVKAERRGLEDIAAPLSTASPS